MQFLLQPEMSSAVADAVIRYHIGHRHPNRFRTTSMRRLQETTGGVFSWKRRRGAGTQSRLSSIVLPYLVAKADQRSELAQRLEEHLGTLHQVVENSSQTSDAIRRTKKRAKILTDALEDWAREESAISVEQGRVAHLRGRWALLAIGDPRLDSYRLERVPANALEAASIGIDSPFLRVVFHEAERVQRFVYLPALDEDEGPSPAVLEMLARVEPARPINELDARFLPKD